MPTCLHGWGSDGMNPSGCPQCDALGRERDRAELAALRAEIAALRDENQKLRAQLETLRAELHNHLVIEVGASEWFCGGCDDAAPDLTEIAPSRAAVVHIGGCPLHGVEPLAKGAR
jgi:hypothetical protein